MAEPNLDLSGLVRTLVEPIIEYKDDLEIIESEQENDALLIEVRVNEEDTGKVIGRQGRVIKAIRTITRAAASRAGEHVDVELLD